MGRNGVAVSGVVVYTRLLAYYGIAGTRCQWLQSPFVLALYIPTLLMIDIEISERRLTASKHNNFNLKHLLVLADFV